MISVFAWNNLKGSFYFIFIFFIYNDLHWNRINKNKQKIHRTLPRTSAVFVGGKLKIKIYQAYSKEHNTIQFIQDAMWKISYIGERALGGNEQLFFKQGTRESFRNFNVI